MRWTREQFNAYQARRAASSTKPEPEALDIDNSLDGDKDKGMRLAAQAIWKEYLKVGSIHKACVPYGISGETARQCLIKAGFRLKNSKWTQGELLLLKTAYTSGFGLDLDALAERLSRTHAAVACKANELGICSERGKQVVTESAKKHISEGQKARFLKGGEALRLKVSARMKAFHATHEHPRGMLGKTHTQDAKNRISAAHSGISAPRERVRRQMETRLERYGTLAPINGQGRSWKAAWRVIGGLRIYARSRWEANYARYLEFLKIRGEIISWDHEPDTFWFDKVKRGAVSYLPDFKVTLKSGIEYHEVKGWMDNRSKTKIKRMAKYHPDVKLVVIDDKRYKALAKTLKLLITEWE